MFGYNVPAVEILDGCCNRPRAKAAIGLHFLVECIRLMLL